MMPAYNGGGGGETLIDHEGAWVAAILGIPIAIAAAPLIARARSRRLALIVSSGLALAFVLATGFTVGLFYAPTAVLLTIAAGGLLDSGGGNPLGGLRQAAAQRVDETPVPQRPSQ